MKRLKDINLLPEELKVNTGKENKLEEFRDKVDPKMILMGIITILTLLVVFFLPFLYNILLEQRLASIQSNIKSQKFERVKKARVEIANENTKIQNKKQAITEIDTKNYSVSEILSAVDGIIPAGCSVSSIMYSGETVNISGNVAENIQIGEILTRAKRLNFFSADSNAGISFDEKKKFTFTFNLKKNGG